MAEIVGVVVGVVQFVTQCLFPSAEGRIKRWRQFKSNYQNLKTEVETLKVKSRRIHRQVDAAKKNGDEIEEDVQKWLEKAKEFQENFQKWLERASKFIGDDQVAREISKGEETATASEAGKIREGEATAAAGEIGVDLDTAVVAEEIREDEETAAAKKGCFNGSCPDLKARYKLSKEAGALWQAVVKHVEAGRFDKISYPVIPKDPRLSNKDYEAFESRSSTLTKVICSLSNPNVNVVGIYGMGGIGKTTLAKEVAKQAKENNLFDSVIFVEVTEKPDVIKIQQEIAEKLGLTLSKEETEPTRAGKLCQRLKNEKKILLILDNVWAHLDLQAIGIPLGDGCQVLLTARRLDVLEKMDSQPNFLVDLLGDEEAWRLFKKMTGDHIEGNELKYVATEVVKKCAHLLIVIVTIARALRNKRLSVWEGTLQQMRLFSPENIQGIHASIELSYNYLESEVLKKTLLLIRYANIVSIDELLLYGMSLSLFEGIKKMEERRVRIRTLIQQLKDSCLLLESNSPGTDLSMHDVVGDVTMSIAARDLRVFTKLHDALGCPDNNTVFHSIVLKDMKTGELPKVLECQQLKLLSLSKARSSHSSLEIPNEFFTRMTELKVLVMDNVDLRPLPPSLHCLTNLQALGLYNCQLDNIGIIGDLKKLEILSFKDSEINQFPVEVGHLTQLKVLNLRCQNNFNVIPPDVISLLSQLEELYMRKFDKWEGEGLNKNRQNISLDELKHLSNLTCLEIRIKDAKTLPRDLFFNKLKRYKIHIGSSGNIILPKSLRKSIVLSLFDTNLCLKDGHIMQLKGVEVLLLYGSQDMENVVCGLDRDGFPQLKYLVVSNNDNILCIVDSTEYVTCTAFPALKSLVIKNLINLEKICHQLTAELSFSQLREIKVNHCNKLKNIFSFSIARRFQLLQSIDVSKCENMKEIFAMKREDESSINISEVIDNIKLSQLRSLRLISLPQLRSLEYNNNDFDTLFHGKVALPNLEVLNLEEINVERIWQNPIAAMSSGIQNLTKLIVMGCNNLRYLFSSSMIRNFVQLQRLEIYNCRNLEEIMVIDDDSGWREEERKNNVAFPISNRNNCLYMWVSGCDRLKTLFSRNIYRKLLGLGSLSVRNCGSLEVIFDLNDPNFEDKHGVAVTQLSRLDIADLPKLKHVWTKDSQKFFSFEKLEKVRISGCNRLKNVFSASLVSSLSQLKSFDIRKCGVEEIIFVTDEGTNTNPRFVFPRVISLTIKDLPNFTTFFPRRYTMDWPMLKGLNMKNITFQLESNNESQAQFLVKKSFPTLEILSIKGNSMTTIWHFPKDLLCKIRYLQVVFDDSTIISSLDFLRRFDSIKSLKVVGDSSTSIENRGGTFALIKCLNKCSYLKHLFKEESNMDHLVHLMVMECNNLVNLVPSLTSFQNLITLEVYGCQGLTNIVTYSTAKSLGQLRKMNIQGCCMIIELLTVNEGDEATDYEIVFGKLKELYLFDLESFTSFCSANYTLKFPSLEELTVNECPKMKSFCRGKLSTPKLQKVNCWRNWRHEECWKGDLNTTMQQLYKETYERSGLIMIDRTSEIEDEEVVASSSNMNI